MDRNSKRRPWWRWLLIGIGVLFVLSAITSGGSIDDSAGPLAERVIAESSSETEQGTVPTTETTPTTTSTATTTGPPPPTLREAQVLVDIGDYRGALSFAADIGARAEKEIRGRIANRIARRLISALKAGDRQRVKFFVTQADRYPTTTLTRQARTRYKAAKARAAERARQRRAVAERRRQEAAARRAAEAAEEAEQEAPEAPAPSAPSGGTCADTPMTDFPVPPGDPRDRDGDGIACES